MAITGSRDFNKEISKAIKEEIFNGNQFKNTPEGKLIEDFLSNKDNYVKVLEMEIAENIAVDFLNEQLMDTEYGFTTASVQSIFGLKSSMETHRGYFFEKMAGGILEAGSKADIPVFKLTDDIIIPIEAKTRKLVTEYFSNISYAKNLSFLKFRENSLKKSGMKERDYAKKRIMDKMDNLILGRWEKSRVIKSVEWYNFVDIELYLKLKEAALDVLLKTGLISVKGHMVSSKSKKEKKAILEYSIVLKYTELAKVLYQFAYRYKNQFELLRHVASEGKNIVFKTGGATLTSDMFQK